MYTVLYAYDGKRRMNNTTMVLGQNTNDEAAYIKIKSAIIKGIFKSGERLTELGIAEKLGISRTPVRQAFNKLEQEGFLQKLPYKGVAVRKFTYKEAENIFQLRAVLEGLAAYLVAMAHKEEVTKQLRTNLAEMDKAISQENLIQLSDIDNDFHYILDVSHENDYLAKNLLNLRNLITILRVAVWTLPGHPIQSRHEHNDILSAIEKGEAEKARRLVETHILDVWEMTKHLLFKELSFEDGLHGELM